MSESINNNENIVQWDSHYENSDEQLISIISNIKKQILVIGVGGAGNNTISRLQELCLDEIETLAINTDAQDLFHTNSNYKLLIGEELTGGMGAGNDWRIAEQAAELDVERIRKFLNKKVIFIICGLGGGTGTGATPVLAREAKKNGAIVIVICTIPFKVEGENKRITANLGLKRIDQYVDSIIPIRNDKLLKLFPNIPILNAFKIIDEVIVNCIKTVFNIISKCGLINLDLADLINIFSRKNNEEENMGFIGMAEVSLKDFELILQSNQKSSSETKSDLLNKILRRQAIKALENPLLDIDINEIKSCVVSISSNQNLTLKNLNEILTVISSKINPNAKIKIGTIIDAALDKIQIYIIGQGSSSPYVFQAKYITKDLPFKTHAEFIL